MKRVLMSVSDKTGLFELARAFKDAGWEIVSTGGTARALKDGGFEVVGISEVTGFPEILDGRVKTLDPHVHGAILARPTPEHMKTLEEHDITPIDAVVVNLYPFEATIAREGCTVAEAIENIDIGGPTMVRSAAKNHERVAILVSPRQYPEAIESLSKTGGFDIEQRRRYAREAFEHTARYDAMVSNYLERVYAGEDFPVEKSIGGEKIQAMRYGENPHQKAALYRQSPVAGSITGAVLHQGKPLSYNNIVDVDAAWALVNEFHDAPTCAVIKHTNPCGLAFGSDIADAYRRALSCDPVSAFGGIIAANREVDEAFALEVVKTFMEAVIAPSYTEAALEVFKQKKNLRVLDAKGMLDTAALASQPWIEPVSGGFLVQERNLLDEDGSDWKVVGKTPLPEGMLEDIRLAWKAVKHVKSNAITVARDSRLIGVGAGQMNRVGSARIALEEAGELARGAVLASDAFFPFADSIDAAHEAGIRVVVEPGGSIRDAEVIEAADRHGIVLVFTGRRHFKH